MCYNSSAKKNKEKYFRKNIRKGGRKMKVLAIFTLTVLMIFVVAYKINKATENLTLDNQID